MQFFGCRPVLLAVKMHTVAEHAHAENIAGVRNRETVFGILYELIIILL
jgi:hypothetical protein